MAACSSHFHVTQASGTLVGALDDFLCIAKFLFGFTRYLLAQAFDLLFFVANQFACLLLNFADDVFYGAFDLIFVHFHSPLITAIAANGKGWRMSAKQG
jgi:hypothetical protein